MGALIIGIVGLAWSIGSSIYQNVKADKMADRQEKKVAEQTSLQEKKAKRQALAAHNQALKSINQGYLVSKRELLMEKRKTQAEVSGDSFGRPVSV